MGVRGTVYLGAARDVEGGGNRYLDRSKYQRDVGRIISSNAKAIKEEKTDEETN